MEALLILLLLGGFLAALVAIVLLGRHASARPVFACSGFGGPPFHSVGGPLFFPRRNDRFIRFCAVSCLTI